jgi:transcriptional regulator with XRE-family HTH domain
VAVEGYLQRTVGKNLRAYREAKNLSQEAFADVLGYHRTYMGGIERGERNLTLKSLERIAEKLELDPLVLLASAPRFWAWHRKGAIVSRLATRPRPFVTPPCQLANSIAIGPQLDAETGAPILLLGGCEDQHTRLAPGGTLWQIDAQFHYAIDQLSH